MKFKSILISLLCLFPSVVTAQWMNIGKADYNWGPFHVYTLFLYTESGSYQDNERPLMLSFKYEKPVEGKNFAITLIKEIEKLKISEADSKKWLEELQRIFPDFSPNDTLSYIALADKGYFVLNDTVLGYEFEPQFSNAFISIWLSPNGNFGQLREQLLDKTRGSEKHTTPQPETAPLNEDNANPELPPYYELNDKDKAMS